MLFRSLIFLVACLAAGSLFGAENPASTNSAYYPLWQPNPPNTTDMVLIYQGGAHRPAWTADDFAPYVDAVDPRDHKVKWLFDGFLFIEFLSPKGHAFEEGLKRTPADKQDWSDLLATNFAPGHGLAALEQVCADTESRIGRPLRPRQVVLTLPEPLPGATNWGELNGRQLNFSNVADRVVACEWQIDNALKQWQALAPKHLTLAGFYYVPEQTGGPNATFLPLIAEKIHKRGKQFFWIPYFNARGAGAWKEHGFDAAWYQPNYFFHPEVPMSRLQQACDFARNHGMGLEMELDDRMMSKTDIFAPRMDDYLRAFDAAGVKTNSSMAYYEGGGTLEHLYNSTKPEMRSYYDRMAEWVIDRQAMADEAAKSQK